MKKFTKPLFLGRRKKPAAISAVAILLAVVLGCFSFGSKGVSAPSEYFGNWEGEDGSTISIRGDGSGDYKSGGTEINGGSIDYNAENKTISITLFGLGKTLKIDESPNNGQMKLSGVVYTKKGDSKTSRKDEE